MLYRVLGKSLELLLANGARFYNKKVLFADNAALVADSEEKMCGLVSEFGRVFKIIKLRVNGGVVKL